jgi:hypothetical protein
MLRLRLRVGPPEAENYNTCQAKREKTKANGGTSESDEEPPDYRWM